MTNIASFNFTIGDAFRLYADMLINVKSFPIFAIAALVFVILIALNIENKNANFLYYLLNSILVGVIIYKYGKNIIDNLNSFIQLDIYRNIYFFLANTVVSLILITLILRNNRRPKQYKYFILVAYYLILVNSLFMLAMSHYLEYEHLMVLVNTYPMILFGNIASTVLYIIIIVYWLFFAKKIKKHRLGNHL